MNGVDIAVIVLLLASGVFALMRGFVYEVLAVTGWVVAALAAFWGYPRVTPYVLPYISNLTTASIACGLAIFLVVLVVSSFITHGISRQVRKSPISAVDRSLGFAFGLLRGLVLGGLCFIVVDKLMAPEEPAVLTAARTRPLLAASARLIETLIPGHAGEMENKAKAAADAASQALIYSKLASPKPRGIDKDAPDGKQPEYDNSGLEKLIENNSNGNGK